MFAMLGLGVDPSTRYQRVQSEDMRLLDATFVFRNDELVTFAADHTSRHQSCTDSSPTAPALGCFVAVVFR